MGRRGEHRSEILSSWALPFREARTRLGKSNGEIRAATGLANQTINKILKGDNSVLVRHIQRLAAYFGFEVTITVVEELKDNGMMSENAPSSVKTWVVNVSLEGVLVQTWLCWEGRDPGRGRWATTENLDRATLFPSVLEATEEFLAYMTQDYGTGGTVLGVEIKFRGLSYPNPGG